jgi:hypothetical protein
MSKELDYILFDYWPGIWIYFFIWGAVAFAVTFYLWTRKDCDTCNRVRGLRRSALLALAITPSILTDAFIVALPAPALMGFLFMIPALISPEHWSILPFIGLLYVLPWLAMTALIFLIWCLRRGEKQAEQDGTGQPM